MSNQHHFQIGYCSFRFYRYNNKMGFECESRLHCPRLKHANWQKQLNLQTRQNTVTYKVSEQAI